MIEDLLRKSGRRPEVPEDAIASIVGATRVVWERRLRRRRIRRAAWTALPLAAALGIAVFLFRNAEPAPPAWIEVPQGRRVILRPAPGSELRLASGTRLQLVSPRLARLEYGTVFVECPSSESDVTVRTSAGDFVPVGTKFEVSVERGGLTLLRVRDGVVALRRAGHEDVTVAAGQELSVSATGEIAATNINIEGKSLRTFLDWVARQKGWQLAFADDRAAAVADSVILHGSVDGMSVDEALQTIAAGSGFTYHVQNGVLRVEGL